jgi:signal transduction histidine kinase/phage shock protein PspC (stress-responsive transcriptional regulator)
MQEPTWPPHRPPDGWISRPDRVDRWGTRLRRLQGTCTGEPLRRDVDDRLGGGVASGVARWRGFNPTTVRIAFVIAALISQGWVVPFYFAGWLLLPARVDAAPSDSGAPEYASVWSRARHDSRGITLAVGIASLLSVVLLMAGVLSAGIIQSWGWPQVASAVCLVLIWRNAPEGDQAVLRRVVAPLNIGSEASRRGTRLRVAIAIVLLAGGIGLLASARTTVSLLRPLGGVVLVLAACVLLLGPWWLRIARDLVLERQARARAEERADMAARVHDSVLQTLALIQRRADDPAQVTQLARAQERELRSWLFGGQAPGSVSGAGSLAAGVRQIQQDIEARHGVPVEVVTVGDCPLDDDLAALIAAAREAVVNAAKWSGAPVIALFAEVTPEDVEVVVRDRGKGFEPAFVPADRKGLAESIRGRMSRHGGTVAVQAALGEGVKVSLKMPRAAAARSAARE